MNNSMFMDDIPWIIVNPCSIAQVSGQCDCACATIGFIENKIPQIAQLNRVYFPFSSLIKQPINQNHSVILSPFTQTFAVLNSPAMTCLETSRIFADDAHIRYIQEQLLQIGLLVPEGWTKPTMTEAPDTVTAWLHLTDRCNLRCAYCFLPHTNADMSPVTGKAAIDATLRSAKNAAQTSGLRAIKLKYAGGEPLLRFPLIVELQQYAQASAEQAGFALAGVVISNGTLLTAEMVKQMQALKLRLTISLDALPSQTGNLQRAYSDGRDAARETMQAIDLSLEQGVTPEISITVSSRNIGGLPKLLEWVLQRDLPFSLNFYRESACSQHYQDLRLQEETMISGMLAAYKVIEANLPNRSLLASLADRANFAMPHIRTCSVGQSYLVFDPMGRVAKCQMQLDQPVTSIHADDPLAVIQADSSGMHNPTVDEKGECATCQWKYWCAGGCPLEAFRTTGRYTAKSPHCNIYKALYPEVLRLEGLRLLKYAAE